MKIKTVELHFEKPTDEVCLLDITRQVEHSVVDSNMSNGIAIIHTNCPNAAITTMEFEPGTVKDLTDVLDTFTPAGASSSVNGKSSAAAHYANGQHQHDVRPSLIGSSITVPFKDNRVMLGKWQEVVLIDFDGAANKKKVIVQIMGE